MILVKGSSQRGKSQSIKRLATTFPFASIIRPWSGDDYDSYIIGTIKDSEFCGEYEGFDNEVLEIVYSGFFLYENIIYSNKEFQKAEKLSY